MIFKVDPKGNMEDYLETIQEKKLFRELQNLSDSGEINTAENLLFEQIDTAELSVLKVALVFYDYLNSLSEAFLFRSDFSREEIRLGLCDIITEYGLEGFVQII